MFLENLRTIYIDWKMANDDELWTTLHRLIDEPEPESPYLGWYE